MDLSKLNSVWDNVLNVLKTKLSDNNVFNTFFQNTKLYSIEGDNAYIEVLTKFEKELLETRYLNDIISALKEVTKMSYTCIIRIKKRSIFYLWSERRNKKWGCFP